MIQNDSCCGYEVSLENVWSNEIIYESGMYIDIIKKVVEPRCFHHCRAGSTVPVLTSHRSLN